MTLLLARLWSVHLRQAAKNFKLGLGRRLPSAEAGSQAAVVVRARARLVAGVTPGQGRESEPARGEGRLTVGPGEGRLRVRDRGGSQGLVQEMRWVAGVPETRKTRAGAAGRNVGLLFRPLCQEGQVWQGGALCPGGWWASGWVPA